MLGCSFFIARSNQLPWLDTTSSFLDLMPLPLCSTLSLSEGVEGWARPRSVASSSSRRALDRGIDCGDTYHDLVAPHAGYWRASGIVPCMFLRSPRRSCGSTVLMGLFSCKITVHLPVT